MPETKKGSSGMRSLTKEPKLATVNPTENAKKIENSMANNSKGFLPINLKNPKNLSRNNKNTVISSK